MYASPCVSLRPELVKHTSLGRDNGHLSQVSFEDTLMASIKVQDFMFHEYEKGSRVLEFIDRIMNLTSEIGNGVMRNLASFARRFMANDS